MTPRFRAGAADRGSRSALGRSGVLNAAVSSAATDYSEVSAQVFRRGPGEFAERRFRERRNAWLRRIWWVFPLMAVVEIAVILIFAVIFGRSHLSFYVGLAVGIAAATVLVLADSPPQHIERWRHGARGEKGTRRALRTLAKNGWTVVHALPRTFGGNVDHVLVGPGGV